MSFRQTKMAFYETIKVYKTNVPEEPLVVISGHDVIPPSFDVVLKTMNTSKLREPIF